MKLIYYSVIILFCFSCGKNKSVLLPEIENAKITKVFDVSPAYLFYDETREDSIELNRKNLIGTTNWLFNVDKRLTLGQAIPKIKFLQNKKRNAQMHKNEEAKNYYTCNDISIQNLGFIEFTETHYRNMAIRDYFKDKVRREKVGLALNMITANKYTLEYTYRDNSETQIFSNLEEAVNKIKEYYKKNQDLKLYLLFSSDLSFQQYITTKSKIQDFEKMGISIDFNEFIY